MRILKILDGDILGKKCKGEGIEPFYWVHQQKIDWFVPKKGVHHVNFHQLTAHVESITHVGT